MGRQRNHPFHGTERTTRLRKAERRNLSLGPAANTTTTSMKTGGGALLRYNVYEPFDTAHDSFRLLRLYPGSEGTPIRCKLFNAQVSRWKQKYAAGSYVWGPKKHRKTIIVNERRFLVTTNLGAFLAACRLHLKDEPLVLWIDAICIDQRSELERNHQVQIMELIYRNAKRTYSWLGRAHSDSNWLFDTLNDPKLGALAWSVSPMSTLPPQYAHRRRLAFNRSGDALGKRLFTALAALAIRPYWTRLWILQEVVLSAEVVLVCGSRRLNWDYFPITPLEGRDARFQGISEREIKVISQSWMCRMYLERRNFLLHIPLTDFNSLYARFGSLKCSVSHDSVFGLLGLAQTMGTQKCLLRVDYSMSKVGLILEVLRTLEIGLPLSMTLMAFRILKVDLAEIAHWLDKRSTEVRFNQEPAFEECDPLGRSMYGAATGYSGPGLYDCYFTPLRSDECDPVEFVCWYYAPGSTPAPQDSLVRLASAFQLPLLIVRPDQSQSPRIVGVAIDAYRIQHLKPKVDSWQLYLRFAKELAEGTEVTPNNDHNEACKPWSLKIDFNSLLRLAACVVDAPLVIKYKQTARRSRSHGRRSHDINQPLDRAISYYFATIDISTFGPEPKRSLKKISRLQKQLRY